jgi:large subunit ribosomal protein L9
MQVILFQNVDKLGMQGDVVNVANGYYRNFLGPRGVAVQATKHNLKRLEAKRAKLQTEAEKQVQEARAFAEHLSSAELKFVMKSPDGKKLFGSVHDHEIAVLLIEQGFNIEKRQVQHEPIKETGTHKIKVKLVGQVEAVVDVVIEAEPIELAKPAATEPSGELEAADSEDKAGESADAADSPGEVVPPEESESTS